MSNEKEVWEVLETGAKAIVERCSQRIENSLCEDLVNWREYRSDLDVLANIYSQIKSLRYYSRETKQGDISPGKGQNPDDNIQGLLPPTGPDIDPPLES